MKVEQGEEKPAFKPVTITLDTKEEFLIFYQFFHYQTVDEEVKRAMDSKYGIRIEQIKPFSNSMFGKLETIEEGLK